MNYAGVNAKVKAMKGRLLKSQDYYNICASASFHEAGVKLRAYPDYAGIVDEVVSAKAENRHDFERKLDFALEEDYKKIYGFIDGLEEKRYLQALMEKREIHFIKRKLCYLYDTRNIDYGFEENDTEAGKYYRGIDPEALSKAENLRQFIDSLQGTKFYDALNNVYRDDVSLYELEMALDFYYYTNMWKMKNNTLKGPNRDVAAMVLGAEIDMQNILWIYRLKNYYTIRKEVIYRYIMPVNYKVSAADITRMVEADKAELMGIMGETAYGHAFSDYRSVEDAYYKVMRRAHRLAMAKGPNSISVILDYLFRKGVELKNIVSAFEGVKYSMAPEDIIRKIHVLDKGGGSYA